MVLIHGAGGNTREFTFAFMDRLTDRYRVIVRFDQPDHIQIAYQRSLKAH
jgi:pimeloyl-ACP methyl ester carboxylesterase